FPVVIAPDQSAVAIAQLEDWVAEGVVNSEVRQRGTNRPHQDFRVSAASTENETADQHVLSGLHNAARAEIGQFRVSRLVHIINLHESHSRGVVLSSNRRGVTSRR